MHRNSRPERGFTLVMVALTLVALLVFAAFAIDLGQVYVERRHDQNSADAAATSAAVVLLEAGDLQDGIDEVLAKVDVDLGRTLTTADWTTCNDPNPLQHTVADLIDGGATLTPDTECISFSASFGRVRVHLPDQVIETTFGQVVGVDSFTSTAFAEAGIEPNGGGSLPFVVLAHNGAGDQICLRIDGTGHPQPPNQQDASGSFVLDPCDEANFDAAGGARGTLEPVLYEDSCNSPGNQSIVDAIMVGADHPLGIFDPPVGLSPGDSANAVNSDPSLDVRIDGDDNCTVALPNSVKVETGLTGFLMCALLENPCDEGTTATSALPGRLSDDSSGSSFAGEGIDDTPLWDFFLGTVPSGSCTSAATSSTEFHARRLALLDCLANWSTGDPVLFTEAVASSKRFGYVPQIAEFGLCDTQPDPAADEVCTPPDGSLTYAHINSFAPVYIDGVYEYENNLAQCDTTNPATPSTYSGGWAIHYPGFSPPYNCGDSSGSDDVHRVSAIVLPCGALPLSVCDPSQNPPFPGPVGINRVRLVK